MRARHALVLFLALVWAQVAVAVFVLTWGYPFIALLVATLSLLGGVFFVSTAYSVFFGAPFVPTDHERVRSMLLHAGLKPGEKLADLGSGDGRIVIAAAKAGAFAEGWEVSPYLWLWSQWNIRRAGVGDRARVHLGSYWDHPFDDVDVVTLFLITMQMPRMERKLRAEMKPGGRVVSYAFTFPHWPSEGKLDGTFLYVQR